MNPNLLARNDQGKPRTVCYEVVNAMLLNEFVKEHRKVEEQDVTITELKSMLAQKRKDFQALTSRVEEQASHIQKVSAQIEVSATAPRIAATSR